MELTTFDKDFRVRVYCMDIWIQGLTYDVMDKRLKLFMLWVW
jgi:hypothetical protein